MWRDQWQTRIIIRKKLRNVFRRWWKKALVLSSDQDKVECKTFTYFLTTIGFLNIRNRMVQEFTFKEWHKRTLRQQGFFTLKLYWRKWIAYQQQSRKELEEKTQVVLRLKIVHLLRQWRRCLECRRMKRIVVQVRKYFIRKRFFLQWRGALKQYRSNKRKIFFIWNEELDVRIF